MKKILVIGSMNMDFVLDVETIPQVGETVLAKSLELIPGGKGANQAYAAAKLGGDVTMLGAVGDDEHGEALIANLASVGVDISRIKRLSGVATGAAFIEVSAAGENNIVVLQGVNAYFLPEDITANIEALESCDILIMQMEIPLETIFFAAKEAHRLGKTVILDPAPGRGDIPKELFEYVDIIKPNEVELGALLGKEISAEDVETACKRVQELGVADVVVTLGGEGAILFSENSKQHIPSVKGIKVVDTTAAGDCFTASLALAIAKGFSVLQAVRFATRAAAISVTRKGAQPSIPSADEVDWLWTEG